MIPLHKLISLSSNKYIFSRAAMKTIDRIDNIDGFEEVKGNWKIVPAILKLMLDENIKYNISEEEKGK